LALSINVHISSNYDDVLVCQPASTADVPSTPIPAGAGAPSRVYLDYPNGCNPNRVPAGLIVFAYGVGGGSRNVDKVQQAIGPNTYGTIQVDRKTVPPAASAVVDGQGLDSHGRTQQPACDDTQCGFATYGAIQLAPGDYDLTAAWPRADGNLDPRSCRLTVVAP
jgi:hypothetical protein